MQTPNGIPVFMVHLIIYTGIKIFFLYNIDTIETLWRFHVSCLEVIKPAVEQEYYKKNVKTLYLLNVLAEYDWCWFFRTFIAKFAIGTY